MRTNSSATISGTSKWLPFKLLRWPAKLGTDRLSLNVGNQLPTLRGATSRKAKTSSSQQRKPAISHSFQRHTKDELAATTRYGIFTCYYNVPTEFYVFLTVHLGTALGKWPTWCTVQLRYTIVYYFNSLHVSSDSVLIIRRSNCINTASGIVFVDKWPSGVQVRTGRSLTESTIPDMGRVAQSV